MIPNPLKLSQWNSDPPTVYSLLKSYVNFANDEPVKVTDLAKAGRSAFFDFEYPLTNLVSKEDFECMILNHFIMRRIGYETVTAFKIALNVKLNEIMPLYNKLFESIANWNIFSDGETINRMASNNRSISNAGTNGLTNSTTTSDTSDQRYSNTPQNALADVRNGQYVTEYSYNQDSGSTSSTSNNTTSNNTIEGGNESETIVRSPSDKMRLYTEFLKNRQNIYTMIFKDLDPLFYQII